MVSHLRFIAIVLLVVLVALVVVPVAFAIFSDHIANRVHLIEAVVIAAFGTLGTLLGAVKSIEHFGGDKE